MTVLHLVVPDGVDDPARPSGGNTYDRRLRGGLLATAWDVREHAVAGRWPRPRGGDLGALARVIADVPDGALTLVDGLIASAAPGVLVPGAARLRLVVLVHMPLEDDGEAAVLDAASAVVTTSRWTRERLLARYPLRPERVHVAEPGVDPAPPAPGTGTGGALLCVAAVTPDKGHEVLLGALARVADEPWRCDCVGPLDRDAGFAAAVRRQAAADGIAGRVTFRGPLAGDELDRAYQAADVTVLASRAETYGMVVTEALARGLPVIASGVGGVPEALGRTPGGRLPGLLVPPGDAVALAGALREWLRDAGLRHRLRESARERRTALPGWAQTADRVAHAVREAAQLDHAATGRAR